MGYRFVLTKSQLALAENCAQIDVKLTLNNVGFGNLNRVKKAKLLFVNEDGEVAFEKQTEQFTGSAGLDYSVNLSLENGKYEVYLCLYGEELDGVPLYALQFANDGLWNADLKANKIGSFEVK